jgi:hypothetical protein
MGHWALWPVLKTKHCSRTGRSPAKGRLVTETFLFILYKRRVARFFSVQFTSTGKNILNYHKIYQMSIKYIKWTKNIPNVHKIPILTSSIARPTKIYPNCDFWSENIPSGNQDRMCCHRCQWLSRQNWHLWFAMIRKNWRQVFPHLDESQPLKSRSR